MRTVPEQLQDLHTLLPYGVMQGRVTIRVLGGGREAGSSYFFFIYLFIFLTLYIYLFLYIYVYIFFYAIGEPAKGNKKFPTCDYQFPKDERVIKEERLYIHQS